MCVHSERREEDKMLSEQDRQVKARKRSHEHLRKQAFLLFLCAPVTLPALSGM